MGSAFYYTLIGRVRQAGERWDRVFCKNLPGGRAACEDRPSTAGLMRVGRRVNAASKNGSRGLCLLADSKGRAFGPSRRSLANSKGRAFGRCLKGTGINLQCHITRERFPREAAGQFSSRIMLISRRTAGPWWRAVSSTSVTVRSGIGSTRRICPTSCRASASAARVSE